MFLSLGQVQHIPWKWLQQACTPEIAHRDCKGKADLLLVTLDPFPLQMQVCKLLV